MDSCKLLASMPGLNLRKYELVSLSEFDDGDYRNIFSLQCVIVGKLNPENHGDEVKRGYMDRNRYKVLLVEPPRGEHNSKKYERVGFPV